MSRFSRMIPPRRALLGAAFVALVSLPIPPSPAAAQDVIISPGPLVRKFPENYCPFPIELEFTATATTAIVHATANTYVFSGSTPIYTNQAIDNIFVVAHADYTAHSVPNTGDYDSCYLGETVPTIFEFDQLSPGTAKLADTFPTTAALWDLSQGGYFDATRSADNDPSGTNPHDESGGCLGLGVENASPSPADSARSSVMVSGLTPGQVYNVTGWWIVGGGIFTDQASLTIKVTGPGATPAVQRTWGALKGRYR